MGTFGYADPEYVATGGSTTMQTCAYSNIFYGARAPVELDGLPRWIYSTATVTGSCALKERQCRLAYGIGDSVISSFSTRHRHRSRHSVVRLNLEGGELPLEDEQGYQAEVEHRQVRISESLKLYMHQFGFLTCNHNHTSDNDIKDTGMGTALGGGPRWFSPLDCRPSAPPCETKNFYSKPKEPLPLLLYLPGIDGTGIGLLRQHHKICQIFEVWCLHIPLVDRTPFSELVKLVEGTVRSEYKLSPNRPIYLIGESVGGCLALAVAANNPHIDLMLIVANPATSFGRSKLQLLKPLLASMPSQFFHGGDVMSMLKDAVLKIFPQPQVLEDIFEAFHTIISYYSVVTNILSVSTLLWKIEMFMTASAYANSRLHAVKAPTLILSSGKDRLLPSLEEGERLIRVLSNCDIRKFKDNGHFLFLEDGVDLVYTIKGTCFYRRGKILDCGKDYVPPTPSEFRRGVRQYWLFGPATAPVMLSTLENGEIVNGLAGFPCDGPTILVGCHLLAGVELIPLVSSIFEQKNIVVRGMAHPIIFTKPRDARYFDFSVYDPFKVMGAVPVSGLNLFKLLASKSHVLLYPGGMREAFHRKGEFYKLFWPEEPEFVRMAARFGAKIVPFGVVGADDMFELFADYHDLTKIPFIKDAIEAETNIGVKLRTERSGEVANQPAHLPIILPKVPGRLYYLFGKPIETEGRRHELMDKQNAQEMYEHVKSEVERSIAYLKERRDHDPYRYLIPRLLYQSIHGFTAQVPTFEL
ncbi:phytyl ester synthase 2, chloroplastic isoform X2 [Spinacia oleracea]|uniref:Phytyl ester synthase 2, chloroplastic isoform X2 n=1 Tax=Spinacia oleracea TaxID=3562 RepID=A0A9R0I9F9_SPIOL|nr:phytyl ester synthase 2, chloroplastic-like isoform X2 [Spinacia oleracea]